MKALTIICAAALCLCWAAFASPVDTVTAHFATPVVVGETTLPAGNVTINIDRGSNYVLVTFRSASGVTVSEVATRVSDFGNDHDSASVDLGQVGNTLRVERIWLPDHTGFSLQPNVQ